MYIQRYVLYCAVCVSVQVKGISECNQPLSNTRMQGTQSPVSYSDGELWISSG